MVTLHCDIGENTFVGWCDVACDTSFVSIVNGATNVSVAGQVVPTKQDPGGVATITIRVGGMRMDKVRRRGGCSNSVRVVSCSKECGNPKAIWLACFAILGNCCSTGTPGNC